jgi:hypothetical protein
MGTWKVHSTHSFHCTSFVWVLAFDIWTSCIGLVLHSFEDQPPCLYWSMIRRTDYEFCFIRKKRLHSHYDTS